MSGHGAATTLRRRLLGVGFIMLVVGGIALSVAGQQHVFRTYTTVSLETDQVGNQLAVNSDVKARGVIIGHVSRITPTADGAVLDLALDPELAPTVPKAASARLLPKTLFGERFVSLEFDTLEGPKLAEGDVIPQDRTETATELYEAFDRLLPMLQTVEPQKLNSTLNAMATALRGQGDQLGRTLKEMGDYFAEFSPHLPELEENFTELAAFSENLADIAPDLIEALDNFRTPSRTLVDKHRTIAELNATLTRASGDLESFLRANRDNIITVGEVSKPTLELLAKYSPMIPCVTGQMAAAVPLVDELLGAGTDTPGLRAKVVIGPAQDKFHPGQDEVEFNFLGGDWGTYNAPWCLDAQHPDMPWPLPYPHKFLYVDSGAQRQPDARTELDDTGVPCDAVDTFGHPIPDRWLAECIPGTAPDGSGNRWTGNGNGNGSGGGGSSPGSASGMANPANTPAEHQLLANLLSLQTGMNASEMPGWGSLLIGPLYRGAEVEIR